ncbi:tetratricopeptide repeat protein 4 isoform X2 [Sminthopsis crassicaudata]
MEAQPQSPARDGPGEQGGQQEEEDAMDAFLDKFRSQTYRGRLHEDTWEQELDKIPMFMKKAPAEINPQENPDLACLQSLIFDDERPPEEQAKTYKDEGNDYFKDKDYKKAVASYTEGLKKKCTEPGLNAVLLTNRAAAHFHMGNLRSALNDVTAARKLKPDHLKAIIRGAMCHLELKNFSEAMSWCDEGLRLDSKEKKLLDTRAKADKLKRAEQRDIRKAQMSQRKAEAQKEALLRAIQARNIRLQPPGPRRGEEEEEEEEEELPNLPGGPGSQNALGPRVSLDGEGRLSWLTLVLYPEYGQVDFISDFHEESRFMDHFMAMFEEPPSWDVERKYRPAHLELFFEEEAQQEVHQLDPKSTLLEALQHPR